ncbi:MAG: PhzF family phenazine biosynthesis protein [Acidobacteria bacterium]|nr:PhzF family phenazine biosynthesis protein [Acidobacteriota bacterium]
MSLAYLHYDVFTNQPLVGNQLAVFLDGRGLSSARMQKLAREMNFSESTFILPPEAADTDVRMRIFTPASELPMAGHPTIGSAFALAQTGAIAAGASRVVFGLGVGPTPVDLEWDENGRLRFAWMTQPNPVFDPPVDDRAGAAAALGLSAGDLDAGLPVQQVSCGVPYMLVPLRDRGAVDRAELDPAASRACMLANAMNPAACFFLFSVSTDRSTETAYSRMFAPGFGITEDPATGSAAGPLGCYLVRHGVVSGDAARRIVSRQGVAMGRPSTLHISIGSTGGEISEVKVGGEAVLVARGEVLDRYAARNADFVPVVPSA